LLNSCASPEAASLDATTLRISAAAHCGASWASGAGGSTQTRESHPLDADVRMRERAVRSGASGAGGSTQARESRGERESLERGGLDYSEERRCGEREARLLGVSDLPRRDRSWHESLVNASDEGVWAAGVGPAAGATDAAWAAAVYSEDFATELVSAVAGSAEDAASVLAASADHAADVSWGVLDALSVPLSGVAGHVATVTAVSRDILSTVASSVTGHLDSADQ